MLLTVTEPTQFLADQQCVVTGYYTITRMPLDHSPVVTGGVTCMLLLTQHNTSVPRTLPIHYPSVTEIRPSLGVSCYHALPTRYPPITDVQMQSAAAWDGAGDGGRVTLRFPVLRGPYVDNDLVTVGSMQI